MSIAAKCTCGASTYCSGAPGCPNKGRTPDFYAMQFPGKENSSINDADDEKYLKEIYGSRIERPLFEPKPVMIRCPECATVQAAVVQPGIPFATYIHHCVSCEYIIMESEWDEVKPYKPKTH